MKRSRFSEEQIIAILKEAEAEPVKTVCARHNVGQATFQGSHRSHINTTSRMVEHKKPDVRRKPFSNYRFLLVAAAEIDAHGRSRRTALTGGTGGAINTVIGSPILAVMENGMNVVGVNAYFQQSILGLVIIISVAFTLDRSKTTTIK